MTQSYVHFPQEALTEPPLTCLLLAGTTLLPMGCTVSLLLSPAENRVTSTFTAVGGMVNSCGSMSTEGRGLGLFDISLGVLWLHAEVDFLQGWVDWLVNVSSHLVHLGGCYFWA